MASEIKEQNLRLNAQLNISETGGAKVSQSYQNVADSLQQIASKARPAQTWLDNLGNTVANTFRYQIVNKFTDALLSGIQEISGYLKDVDKELNNIRIVSGQTQAQVESFLSTAQSGAKALGKTTTDYLEAAQQYYQQGLSTNEVISRTEATLKAANITGQSISDTVQQTTAVLNGFNVSSKDINKTLSVMASLGAATASDFEELSTASQKVASAASTAGIPLNNTMAMITTIASVTRESAESVGTSLNAMIGRFNKLSVDEKQQVSSTIETTLKNTKSGVSMFDQTTGQVRNLNAVLTDLAGVWKTLDKNSQEAILTQLAGTRQANRLASLMNNWDEYQKNLKTAEMAEGSLDAQNQVYMQSLGALENQAKTASMTMWGSLFNTDMLKGYYKVLTDIFTVFGNLFKNVGGLAAIFPQISATAIPIINKLATPLINNAVSYSTNSTKTVDGENLVDAQKKVDSLQSVDVSGTKILNNNQLKKLSDAQYTQYQKSLLIIDEQYKLEQKLAAAKSASLSIDDKVLNKVIETKNAKIQQTEEEKKSLETQKESLIQEQKSLEIKQEQMSGVTSTGKKLQSLTGVKDLNTDYISMSVKNGQTLGKDYFAKRFSGKTDAEIEKIVQGYKNYKTEIDNAVNSLGKENKNLILIDTAEVAKKSKDIKTEITNISNKIKEKEVSFSGSDFTSLLGGVDSKSQEYNKIVSAFNNTSVDLKGAEGSNKFSQLQTILTRISAGNQSQAEILNSYGISQEEFNQSFLTILGITQKVKKQTDDEVTEAQNKVNNNQSKASGALTGIKNAFKADVVGNTLNFTVGAVSAITAMTTSMKQYNSVTATGTQKTQALIQGAGTGLTALANAIPGVGPMIGTLISTATTGLGYLAEKFQWGADEAEKLENKIASNKKIVEEFTQSLAEERNALTSLSTTADDLAKKYQEQKFTYSELTEQEKTNYDQVSDYVEKYAPELILYYDKEGKAVLNLTKLYGNLSKTGRNALDDKYLQDAYKIYSSSVIQDTVASSGSSIFKGQSIAAAKLLEDKEQLQEYQEQINNGNKVSDDDIKKVTDDLTKQQTVLQSLNSDWDELVAKPITYGNASFQNLDRTGQTLIRNLSSYNNFSGFNIGNDEDSIKNYTDAINTFSQALDDSGPKASNFLDMDEQLQISAANMAMVYGLTNAQLQDYIGSMSEASFLSGDFLDKLNSFADENLSAQLKDINAEIDKTSKSISDVTNTDAYKNAVKDIAENANDLANTNLSDAEKQKDMQAERQSMPQDEQDALDQADKLIESYQKQAHAKRELEKQKQELDNRTLALYESNMRKYANSSNASYNKTLDSFKDLQNRIIDADGYTKADLQKKAGRLYAILKGDDADYYKHWISINKKEIADEANKSGVLASNYSTYNEYMSAVDAAYAKAKVIIANTTGNDFKEMERQITNEKYKNLAIQLDNEKQSASASIMVAATVTGDTAVQDAARTTSRIEALKQQVLAEQTAGNQTIDSSSEMMDNILDLYNQAADGLGLQNISIGAGVKVSVEDALGLLDAAEKNIATAAKNQATADGQAAISDAESQLAAYKELLTQSTGTENNFNFDTSDFGDLAYKDTGDEEPSYTTPADGSGSDSDKTKKKSITSLKDVKEGSLYTEEIDQLKKYDDEITQVEHDVEMLSAQRSHLYGSAYLENLDKEIKKQEENLDITKQRLEATEAIAAASKADLETQVKAHSLSLSYSENGSVSNYNDIIEQMESASKSYQTDIDTKTAAITALTDKYNVLKDAYDTAGDNGAENDALNASADEINALADQINAITEEVNTAVANQSTYNDWAKSFKESMDNYEKYAVDEVQKTEKNIQDKISKVLTDKVEAISYPVTIVVEAADQNSKYIELLSAIAKNKGKVTFSVDTTTNFDKLQNTIKEINALMAPNVTGGLNDLLSQTQSLLGKVKDTDLASAPKDLLDAIRKQEETMISTASNLQSIISSMKDAFKTGIDSAVSTLNDALDKFSLTTTAYDNLVNAAQKTNADTFNFLTSASKVSLDISNKQIAQLQEQANVIKATRDGFAKGTDEYLKADQTYIQQMNKIASLQQTAAENINKTITNLIRRNNKDLESTFLGGQTAANIKQTLSDLNEARKKYLAQERRIYETTKLEEDIAADIEKHQDNTAIQKRLKDFQQAELKYLNSKDKLTQSDLDLSQKQYELLKAQIALEEAQEGKEYTRMLQRNSSGNYAYISVADTSKIDAAKEAYQKSIDALYQYASGQYDSYLNNLSNAVSNYETKTNKIITEYQAGNITKEKAEELYRQAQEALKAQYKEAQDGMKTMATQMSGTTELQKLASDKLSTLTTQASTLDKLIQGNAEGFDDLYKEMTGKSVEDTIFSDLNNTAIDLTKNWKELFSVLGTDLSTVDFSKLDTNINTILNSIDDYNKLLKDWSNTAANTVNSIISTDLINQINTNASEINAAASKELESVANTTKAYEAQRAAIEESNASIMDMINALDAASAKIESTFGVTNGAVDTSNLTSGIANTDISSALIPTTISGSDSAALFAKAAQSAGATVTTSQDQYHVEMEFPNVTDKDEIIKAFEGINNYVDQYLANNKNS